MPTTMGNAIAAEADQAPPPPWRRIVDFPLIAMVVAWIGVMVPVGLTAGLFERLVRPSPTSDIVSKLAVAAVMVVAYKLIVPRLGTRRHDDLKGPGAIAQLAAGFAGGTMLFALIVGTAALVGVYSISGPGDVSSLARAVVGDGVFPAVVEEILFRAILFRFVEEFAGSGVAILISSALFGLSHLENPNADMLSTVGIMFEGGILLAAAYLLTRRLWLSMGLHASWNLTQGELFDIPISGNDAHGLVEAHLHGPVLLTGGGFGLEASLISIIIGTAFGVLLLWLAVVRGQVMQPSWVRRRIASSA